MGKPNGSAAAFAEAFQELIKDTVTPIIKAEIAAAVKSEVAAAVKAEVAPLVKRVGTLENAVDDVRSGIVVLAKAASHIATEVESDDLALIPGWIEHFDVAQGKLRRLYGPDLASSPQSDHGTSTGDQPSRG